MREHRTPVSLSTYRTYTLPWKLYLINHYSIFIMTLIRWSYRYLTQNLTVLTIISLFYFTYYYAFNQWLITDQLQRKGWKILRTIKARRTNFFWCATQLHLERWPRLFWSSTIPGDDEYYLIQAVVADLNFWGLRVDRGSNYFSCTRYQYNGIVVVMVVML